MPLANVDVLHGIVNGSTFISEFTSLSVSPSVQPFLSHSAGHMYPQHADVMKQLPEIRFTTPQIKSILDLTDDDGIADLSAANTDLHFKLAADQSNRGASASLIHYRYRAAKAFLILERITAGHDTDAQAQCRLICSYDGTNAPLVYAGSLAVAGTLATAEHYVLGEVHINGSEVDGPQSLDIDYQQNILQAGGSGELFNTFHCQMQSTPRATIAVMNALPWALGQAFDLSSVSLYLRKRGRAARVADATAEHIKFSATDGLGCIEGTNGDGMGPNITTVALNFIAPDATTAPLLVSSTAVAITT